MTGTGFPTGDLGIIVYGSMMRQENLQHLFEGYEDRIQPISLHGYRRIFDAAADRRSTCGNRRAVLNLHEGAGRCNALLVSDVTPAEFGAYARRETGYRFTLVEETAVEGESNALPSEILVAAEARVHADLRPIPRYLRTCLTASRQWGDEFYSEFLATTHLASGETLVEYLDAA